MQPKRPRGRQRIQPGKDATYRCVSLDDATIAKARTIGAGNLSKGLRIAVASYPDTSPVQEHLPARPGAASAR